MRKIFATIMALGILASTTNLWLYYKGKILLSTNLKTGTEVVLLYKEKETSDLIIIKERIKSDGTSSFRINGKTLYYFKIEVPEKTEIKNVQFYGLKKQNITLNAKNEYTGELLRNCISIKKKNLYNLIVLLFWGCYLGWFVVHSFKHGFPKDDARLPKMMNIEFLRIVFTLFIVVRHFGGKVGIWNEAWISVEFFFILSGFLLAYTFNPNRTVYDYLKSKIIRFLPLVLFVSIVRSLFFERISFTDIFIDSLFLREAMVMNVAALVRVNWYINCLFWTSLFYFYLLKTCKKQIVNLLIGIIIFISYSSICSTGWWKSSPYFFVGWGMCRALGGVGLGYFSMQLADQIKIKPSFAFNIFEGVILLYAFLSLFLKQIASTNYMLYVICFVVLLICFIQRRGFFSRFFEKPVFALLSRYCLSVYLVQAIVIWDIFEDRKSVV